MTGITLRPYQQEARKAINHEWKDEKRDKTLLVLPTGTGKTVVFAKVAEDEVRDGRRILSLAHRGELLDQAADKFNAVTGMECAFEKAQETSIGSNAPIIVASVQSMQSEKRLSRFNENDIWTIIVDEAHHAISDSYQKILNHFSNAHVLGVTATPDRGDMRNLGTYFESLAYEYSLPQAIKDGYLCPIKAQCIPLQIDLRKVKVQNGDFAAGDIGNALEPYLDQIADEMKTYCRNRRTVVFLPLISTSQKFRDILNKKGFKAAEVNGKSDDRKEITQAFERGEFNVLCNSMLLTEGWDCPPADCIVILRPTRSRALYSQMVGRGTRLSPETGKKDLLLLDFLWMIERHDLVRPAHLISKDNDTADRMTAEIFEGEETDLIDAEENAQRDIKAEKESALAKELEAQKKKKRQLVDPLQYAVSTGIVDLINYQPTFGWEMDPPTKSQLETLENAGIYTGDIKSKGEAKKLISQIVDRRQRGLATPKQIKVLERFGFQNVGTWPFQSAYKMIGCISSNKWNIPNGINPKTYRVTGSSALDWNSTVW